MNRIKNFFKKHTVTIRKIGNLSLMIVVLGSLFTGDYLFGMFGIAMLILDNLYELSKQANTVIALNFEIYKLLKQIADKE
ncbi:MAG: hypothetical protein RR812_06950 [Vagococcus sp.]